MKNQPEPPKFLLGAQLHECWPFHVEDRRSALPKVEALLASLNQQAKRWYVGGCSLTTTTTTTTTTNYDSDDMRSYASFSTLGFCLQKENAREGEFYSLTLFVGTNSNYSFGFLNLLHLPEVIPWSAPSKLFQPLVVFDL